MPETSSLSEAKRALVEKYLRGDVPQAPAGTDTHLAHADAAATESPEDVVLIQTGGSETPFFFLHGQYEVGGGFYCFRLARALGTDRPFYALEPYRFKGLPVPPSFQAMAAAHVKSLRAVVPEGPYILGGWCNGALLAYEMAQQLLAAGQRVDQLVLMDAVCLRYPAWPRLVRAAIIGLGKDLRVNPQRQLDAYLRLRHGYRYIRHVLVCMRSPRYRRSRGFGDFAREDYPGVYDWAAMDYRPTSIYPGKITFFWSRTRPSLIHGFRVARFRRGWRSVEVAGAAEIRVLPFGHWTCLNEHLDVLAERLNESLVKATAAI
jgi:thioesterase domain-containing protein